MRGYSKAAFGRRMDQMARLNNRSHKGLTIEESQLKYDELVKQVDEELERYFDANGYYPERMRATHPVAYTEGFNKEKPSDMSPSANVLEGNLQRPPLTTLEGATWLIDYNAMQLLARYEDFEIESRSAKEWRMLEREYVKRADYTIMDFYDDFRTAMEVPGSALTWVDYRRERKKLRKCKCKFCLNYFPIEEGSMFIRKRVRRSDSLYCTAGCKQMQMDANKEFRRTSEIYENGTYLPVYAYKTTTEDHERREMEKWEIPIENMDDYEDEKVGKSAI
ncbi:hypothetical protein [Terribacillus saccharophilus]|uniref:hypothetical protein n=1 Tax=Terribacillus saccharophilus TaxID=361277 RepID=UPI003981BC32